MSHRLAREDERQTEAERHEGDAQIEGLRAEAVRLRDVARGEGGERDGQVARGLVEAHGETPLPGPDEVDLHDHGRGPRQALVDPEQDVGRDDPRPARGRDDEERHRHGEEPAEDEHLASTQPVGEPTRGEVRDGLDDPERRDEREGGAAGREPELLVGQQRQHGSLEPHHGAHEAVDGDEEEELREVLPEA